MTSSDRRRRLAKFAVAWLVVLGVQVGLLAYFGGEQLLRSQPIAGIDFDTHITQTWRVLDGLEGWGHAWVYDVQLLAGVPNGVLFDADNKGWEVFTFVLVKLGLGRGQAFNIYVVLAHLLVVPVIYGCARGFGLKPWAALFAAGLAVLYWNFDSWAHWCWYVGMVAYGFASYLLLIPLTLFYRWTQDRKRWQLVALLVALPFCHLAHPYTFLALVVPMTAVYVRAFRSLSKGEHAGVVAVAVATVALNSYWLMTAFGFWHYIVDSSLFADNGALDAIWDFFGLVTEPAASGLIGKRTGFRTLILLASFVMLAVWRSKRDPRTLPMGSALLCLLAIAYLGGYTPLSHTQPYRNLLPAGFLGTLMCAALAQHVVDQGVLKAFCRNARLMVALMCVPAGLFLVQDVLYYAVEDLPKPSPLPDGQRVGFSSLGYPPHASYKYGNAHADELAAWVRAHDDGTGRFLVEGWHWGEQLAWKTDAQIMGGFVWRNLDHSWSNFFRRRPQGIAHPKEFRAYLERYAVKWVIVASARSRTPWWDMNPHLEHVVDVNGFRIYAVIEPVSLLLHSPGQVQASVNQLVVTGTRPEQKLMLRYHWMETLRCRPDCTLERVELQDDPVGFIKIPAPHPADFEVYNAYE